MLYYYVHRKLFIEKSSRTICMVYYKRIPYDLKELPEFIRKLGIEYKWVSIYFPGHKKHAKYGLKDDKVLIIVHK
ncbi:MAG: hypothetical protein QXZ02_05445 [Candidatus Bathyarchaeia archaeon]